MPLRDHFHPPLYPTRSWTTIHSRWANSIADYLGGLLPPRYFAEINTRLGLHAAADVAEWRAESAAEDQLPNGPAGGQAVAVQTYSPPAPAAVIPAVFPDEMEVHIIDDRGTARLVAVVELVSPANKDRPDARRAFAAKCAAYLQRGVGVVVADIVTSMHFNLHNELVAVMQWEDRFGMAEGAHLYAVAYRPTHRADRDEIDVWWERLAVGGGVPTLPLGLRGAFTLPLDLGACYEEACRRAGV
jgi:hypothetical protein